jgi:hypothetical protein
VNRSAGNPLPDEPWPVSARNLLSKREQSFYQTLLSLYPDYKIFVQVALSQLIGIDRNHPESGSIRALYKQLVADFVVCRSDLSVVTVIELDDRSHERADCQRADARKNKALADAGIRLVRSPAGRLPSEDALRALVDGVGGEVEDSPQEKPLLSLVETVDTYEEISTHGWRDDSGAESRELKRIALKAIAGAILLLVGWFVFSQFLPAVVKQALQPLAVPRVRAASVPPKSIQVTPRQIPTAPTVSGPNAEDLAGQKQIQLQAANVLQKKKDQAWAAFYSAPASCEHPADWSAQVECGNLYMRAQKLFEQRWEAEHPASHGTGAGVVLDKGSVGAVHR